MAKKNKDDIDDNDDFNEGNSDDINDADDNFGLPDIEYSPVNREEERKEPAPEESSSEESTPEKEPSPFESVHKRDVIYSASSEKLPSEGTEGSYSGYVPPRRESNAPKIFIFLGVLLLVAAGVWYFGFYQPEQNRIQAQQEQELREEEARVERERQAQADRERQAREEADREAERIAAEAEAAAETTTGSFETIPDRTGRYYIVVASALDGDLATDYAKNLAQEGHNAKILAPKGRNKFHRVAVGDYEDLAGAQTALNDMRSRYGDEVWVVKF